MFLYGTKDEVNGFNFGVGFSPGSSQKSKKKSSRRPPPIKAVGQQLIQGFRHFLIVKQFGLCEFLEKIGMRALNNGQRVGFGSFVLIEFHKVTDYLTRIGIEVKRYPEG